MEDFSKFSPLKIHIKYGKNSCTIRVQPIFRVDLWYPKTRFFGQRTYISLLLNIMSTTTSPCSCLPALCTLFVYWHLAWWHLKLVEVFIQSRSKSWAKVFFFSRTMLNASCREQKSIWQCVLEKAQWAKTRGKNPFWQENALGLLPQSLKSTFFWNFLRPGGVEKKFQKTLILSLWDSNHATTQTQIWNWNFLHVLAHCVVMAWL